MSCQTSEEKEKIARVPYSNVVGSLIYAVMCTWSDICHVLALSVGSKQILSLLIKKQWNKYSDTLKGQQTTCYAIKHQTCACWLQRCRLGWWPWWVQVYFRLCLLAQWQGHYMVQQEANLCCIVYYGGGIRCWFRSCPGGYLVEKIPLRVWHCHKCWEACHYILRQFSWYCLL